MNKHNDKTITYKTTTVKIKSSLVATVALLTVPMAVSAQDTKNDFRAHAFVQAQGGLMLPFTPGTRSDLLTPNVGLSVGAWFSPQVGARIGADGWQQKVLYGETYEKFNRFTYSADLLINLSTILAPSNNNPRFNAYLMGGLGLTQTSGKDYLVRDNDASLAHNLRVGVGAAYRIIKPLSVVLEYRLNHTADYVNTNTNNSNDWGSTLSLGLRFDFAHSSELYDQPVIVAPAVPLTLYQQMMNTVGDRMNTWMKRLKGESKADYNLRTSDDKVEAQRLQYIKDVSTEMADGRINNALTNIKYNRNNETLGLDFSDMPSITLGGVPSTSLAAFANKNNVKFQNTVYELKPDDTYEVLYTEVLDSNGKKYYYRNTQDANTVGADFLPLDVVQQDMINAQRLEALKTNAMAEARSRNIISGNTEITVATSVLPKGDNMDYKVSYTYTVKDGFSAQEDFAPGKYNVENAGAPATLLKIINESMNGEFAKYVKAGKTVDITYTGMADAMPIRNGIAYDGSVGKLVNVPVNVNGSKQNMTVTKKDGITTNEQLSLVRAASVKDNIQKNVSAFKNMKVNDNYSIRVNDNEGGQYRRVTVDFLFHDAF